MDEKLIIAQQIFHESESYLKDTITSNDNLEKKASLFLSVFMSLATACLIFFLENKTGDYLLTSPLIVAAVGLYVSCYFFIKANKPKSFYLSGNKATTLINRMDEQVSDNAATFAIGESLIFQEMTEHNSSSNLITSQNINKGLNAVLITTIATISSLAALFLFLI